MARILRLMLISALTGCAGLRMPEYRGIGGGSARDVAAASELPGRAHAGYVPHGEFRLYWPVTRVRVNRGFRPASDPRHVGMDLGGARGTPILAAHEGVVIYAGSGFRGYGKMVIVEYDKEWATLYGHLSTIAARQGQLVKARDPIGGMGATGEATGVHLHFEVIHNRQPVDPLPLLSRGSQLAGIAY